MSFSYEKKRIILGEASRTGHTVFKEAQYVLAGDLSKRIIFKKNKHHNPLFSRFEVAFTGLARCFLKPDLVPKQSLVKNKKQDIVGLASEHVVYAIERREDLGVFVSIEKNQKSLPAHDSDEIGDRAVKERKPHYSLISRKVNKAEQIPIAFFDQYAPDFFYVLWEMKKSKHIEFDMSSLASVLTSSYTLEEDDLHKGNLGFYVIEKLIQGKKTFQIVFFKIDNDLMMADSVMSHCSPRVVNWLYDDHAFAITKQDLIHFPKLVDSKNYYWPTSLRFLANPMSNKAYSSLEEIQAFTELGENLAFQQAKWREFYKHILIPQTIIEQALEESFDKKDAADRAQLSLITHATIARQAKLRAVLFTIPEFRHFVMNLSEEESESITADILHESSTVTREKLSNNISVEMGYYSSLCARGFVDGDTPLHVAIRLGDYRYHESWQSFSEFAEQENSQGEKPLDVAVAMTMAEEVQSNSLNEARKNPFSIIKSLLKEGVKKTDSYHRLDKSLKDKIETYYFDSIYSKRASETCSSEALLEVLRDVGEDHHFSLKMQKEIAVACMKNFIVAQKNNPDYKKILLDMKDALNGYKNPPAPELQFIRQLRSPLWIIRKIRGLLGGTATQNELNGLINGELNRLNPNFIFSCFSFFFCQSDVESAINNHEAISFFR